MTRAPAWVAILVVVLASVAPHAIGAQASVVSEPPEPSLLTITRQWSRASRLGDLRALRAQSDDLELRVWAGYTLTGGTQAAIVRRTSGRWSAFFARVLRCEVQVPAVTWDTASRATVQRYTAEARRHCGTPLRDVSPGARILTTDSLFVDSLGVSDSAIADVWTAATQAGVLSLPPRIVRDQPSDDPFVYVIEVRRGNEYRASAIEHVPQSKLEGDRHVQAVYAVLMRLLPPD